MIPKDSYPSDVKILRVVSINVNGLRSSVTKGLLEWLEQSDADVVCMQESRITHEQWTDKFKPKAGIPTCSLPNVRAMQVRRFTAASHLFQYKTVWVLNWLIRRGVLSRLNSI